MGVPINFGLCQGGPYNNKHLADHREVFPVAVDKNARKAVPGLVVSTNPDIEWGEYRFIDGGWVWRK